MEVNEALCNWLGYQHEELLQGNWEHFSFPEDWKLSLEQLNKIIAGEIEGYVLDKRWCRKDGKIEFVYPEDREITLAQLETLKLKPAKDFDILGEENIFIGKKVQHVLPPALAQNIVSGSKITVETGEIKIVEYQLAVKGELCDFEARIVFCTEDEIIAIVRDITQRKRSESALHRQAVAMAKACDGIAMLNAAGEVIYCNAARLKIYGYDSLEELSGKSWKVFYQGAEVQRFEQEVVAALAPKGYYITEAVGCRRDGSKVPIDVSRTMLPEEEIICVVRDISAKKQAEAALQSSQRFAQQIAEASPNILYVYHIIEHKAEQQESLNSVQQCGEHLLTLINDVLDLAKIEASKMELSPAEVNFPSFVKSIVDLFQMRAAQKGIAFTWVQESSLPDCVFADEKRLRQVLINLLSNAVKFTKSGGVTFKVGYARDSAKNSKDRSHQTAANSGSSPPAKFAFKLKIPGSVSNRTTCKKYFCPSTKWAIAAILWKVPD